MNANVRRSAARLCAAAVAVLLSFAAGCATFSETTSDIRHSYRTSDYAQAEDAVDKRLAEETGVSLKKIKESNGLDASIDPQKGNALLFLLEKGMIRLARGDAENAVKLFRRCRDAMDRNAVFDAAAFLKEASSLFLDDTTRPYRGADYEMIMVRVMLALADLVEGGGDAYAYAAQVGERQEELIGSPLGEVKGARGYKPRERYKRLGVGAYIQGMLREDSLAYGEAARAYGRALDFEGGAHPVFGPALKRAESGRAKPGTGVLHVFDLAGSGPYLAETDVNPGTEALRLAGILLLITNNNIAVITQDAVPVPKAVSVDTSLPPLKVSSTGMTAETLTILDVNRVIDEQLDANMPWIVARAAARRAIKAVASQAVGKSVETAVSKGKNRKGRDENVLGELATIAASAITTGFENADTRSWTSLPAEIRSARLELPEGYQEVWFGDVRKKVRIAAGHASYALVIRPSPLRPPVVLIDRYSL